MSKFCFRVYGHCQDTYYQHILDSKNKFCEENDNVHYEEKDTFERRNVGFYDYLLKFIIICDNEIEAEKIASQYKSMEIIFNKKPKYSLTKV